MTDMTRSRLILNKNQSGSVMLPDFFTFSQAFSSKQALKAVLFNKKAENSR